MACNLAYVRDRASCLCLALRPPCILCLEHSRAPDDLGPCIHRYGDIMTKNSYAVRPYRPSTDDRSACSRVCALNAHSTSDSNKVSARSVNDELWGDLFVSAYLDRHPEYAWVLESCSESDKQGQIVGYVVGTPDTQPFERYYFSHFWPARIGMYSSLPPDTFTQREQDLIRKTATFGDAAIKEDRAYLDAHPAHIHINLLPQARGQGYGKEMMGLIFGAMRHRGVKGVHLTAARGNEAAGRVF